MNAFLSLPSLRRVVLIAVAVVATFAFGMRAHAQTVVPEGQTLNLSNPPYASVDLLLQGGTVSGAGSYNAYGASVITGVTVSGTAASTINGSSWFNILDPTTFTVADVTSSSAADLLVNISLRPLPGSPDTNYSSSSIIKEGEGTMEMTVHSFIWGATTLNGGALKVSGGNGGYGFFSGAVNVNSATTLTIDSDGTGFGYQNGWKPTSVNINGGTVNGGGNHVWGISGGVNMTGGTLQVDSGSFQWNYTNLNTSASANTATIAGPLVLRGDGGYSGLSANVADGAAETDLLISGDISELNGSLSISKSGSGTLRLSGANSYSGGTTLTAGTLVAGNAAAFGPGTVSVGSGATLDLGSQAVANAITNNGGSLLNAAAYAGSQSVVGTTSLTGTIGGTLTVNSGGTLKGSNTAFTGPVVIAAGGVHSPGNSPGSQTFSSGLAYSGSSTLAWELIANSTGDPGTNYDFLSVTNGDLTIDSTALLSLEFLNTGTSASTVNWANAFWDSAQTWTLIDFTSGGTSTGVFTLAGDPSTWLDSSSMSLASARPGSSFSVANVGGDVVLSYAPVPEPSSFALLGLGGAIAAIVARRRRR